MSMPLGFALASALIKLTGGLFALRLSRHLQWITAFTSGVLIAAALFNLLPEAFVLEHGVAATPGGHEGLLQAAGLGFLFFYLMDLIVPEQHEAGHEDHHHAPAKPRVVGLVGALILCLHSLTDGLLLGAANHAGLRLAEVVGVAVVFHNFSDGVSTVSMMLRNGQTRGRTLAFIALVAACPIVGVLVAISRPPSVAFVPYALASFAGAFLYMGGSHLSIREHGEAKKYAPLITALAFLLVYLLRR